MHICTIDRYAQITRDYETFVVSKIIVIVIWQHYHATGTCYLLQNIVFQIAHSI